VTLHDPAVELEEIKRCVAGRLQSRYPLLDPAEIDTMVAWEAAADDHHRRPSNLRSLLPGPADPVTGAGGAAGHSSWHRSEG
jgi:hypothetical protein